MNKQFNNEEKPLELRVIPTETNEITLMRELVDDKRPNADGVLPTLAVEAIEGCQPGLRIFQKFDGEPTPFPPTEIEDIIARLIILEKTIANTPILANEEDLHYFSPLTRILRADNSSEFFSLIADPNQARVINAGSAFEGINEFTLSVQFVFSHDMDITFANVTFRNLDVAVPDVIVGNWATSRILTINIPQSGQNMLAGGGTFQFSLGALRTAAGNTVASGDALQTFRLPQISYFIDDNGYINFFEYENTPFANFANSTTNIIINNINVLKLAIIRLMFGDTYRYITSIGTDFIRSCTSLQSIDLLAFKNVTSIGASFLYNCSSLKSVDLSAFIKVTSIGFQFLANCSSLQSVDLSAFKNVTSTGTSLLQFCNSLQSVDFGEFNADILTESVNTLAVSTNAAPAYINGVKIYGKYRAAIMAKFPNSNVSPYRNLIDGGEFPPAE